MNNDFMENALRAAKEAGEILMKHYPGVESKFKADNYGIGSVVTVADLESEKKIIDVLKASFPSHQIRGEEGGVVQEGLEYEWHIDPLDGTSNFVRHIPLFGISIGLLKNGEAILGVLYFPALDIMVSAEKGKGCFVNGVMAKVSKRNLSQSLYYSGGKFDGVYQLNAKIAEKAGFVKIIDASSYEFAQIAMGDAEIYYLVNTPHDVVAGVCIVREAGGVVTGGNGENWTLASKMILATNGIIHDEVVSLLKS